jgi:hypothetical protein
LFIVLYSIAAADVYASLLYYLFISALIAEIGGGK